jgi:hypothetical protein
MDYYKLISELGFPMAAALCAGYFVYMTLKFILAGVISNIKSIQTIILSLDRRIRTMDNDLIKIDILISTSLSLPPDVERISRLSNSEEVRKD